MRRSAGMGGGSIMRAVGRAVGGAGIGSAKDAVSAASAGRAARMARVVALPSSSSGGSWPSSPSVVAAATRGSMLCFCDEDEWETVDGREVEVEEGIVVQEQFVFGPVPSAEEAEEAISAIQQMFVPVTFSEEIKGSLQEQEDVKDKTIISSSMLPRSLSTGSQSDWIEPSMHLYSSSSYQSREREKVLDAFRLLQINPSIQRVVVSLSSDRAVWDAVMKNDIVQEFKKSFYEGGYRGGGMKKVGAAVKKLLKLCCKMEAVHPDADQIRGRWLEWDLCLHSSSPSQSQLNIYDESKPQEADKGGDASRGILKWIMDAKAKIMEVLDKITKHLNQIFQSNGAKDEFAVFDDVLRSSFMLSVLVFIVVIMNRAQRL